MKIPKAISDIHLVNQRLKLKANLTKHITWHPPQIQNNPIETHSIARNTLAQYKIISKTHSDIFTDIANTHVGEDKQKIIPNFVTQHRRKEKDFPKTYYNSDDEDALLEKQEAVYIKNKLTHPFYKDFIRSLNTHLQGYSTSDTSETFAQRIAEFSVPLNKEKKLFRGIALSQQELEQIEMLLTSHHIPSIKSMGYYLLHHSKHRHKITSVSTLPEIAEIFAFQTARTLKNIIYTLHTQNVYFPVCITLECDKNAPSPKGLTFPVNKIPDDIQWVKNKNEHEIILDGKNNKYQITDIHYDTQKNYYKITVQMSGIE